MQGDDRSKCFLGDEHMDASEVISMVAETAHNLAALASDETVTHEAPDRCMKAAHDLETSVALILTAPWITRDAPTLTASLQAVNKNLKKCAKRDRQQDSRRLGSRAARGNSPHGRRVLRCTVA